MPAASVFGARDAERVGEDSTFIVLFRVCIMRGRKV